MRKYLLAGLLGLASTAGCRMCACPYDDCYPVVENNFEPSDGAPAADVDYAASGTPTRQGASQPHMAASPHLAAPAQ